MPETRIATHAASMGGEALRLPSEALAVYALGGWQALSAYARDTGRSARRSYLCPECDGTGLSWQDNRECFACRKLGVVRLPDVGGPRVGRVACPSRSDMGDLDRVEVSFVSIGEGMVAEVAVVCGVPAERVRTYLDDGKDQNDDLLAAFLARGVVPCGKSHGRVGDLSR